MQILIRHIHKDLKGREELFEEVVDDPTITVGHGRDQVIQLRDPAVAQRHLEFKAASGGRFHFKTAGSAHIVFDGAARSRGTLKPGDRLELGEQAISAAEPTAGFDGILEVTSVEQEQAVGPATHYRTELTQTGLGARKISWALLTAVLVLFLIVPLTGYFWTEMGSQMRNSAFLPSDLSWSTGPLSNVHHTPEIGKNCNTCHLELFERTPDRACLDCHAGVTGHVNPEQVAVPDLTATRCASCHEEHNEPVNLVRNESGLCIDCHRKPDETATVSKGHVLPEPVRGFTGDAHPEFRLAVLRQNEQDGSWRTDRIMRSAEGISEESHLKFPHQIHMDPEKVESLRTGEPLQCSGCHQLEDNGEHFVPITMERTCRDCHSLQFDDDFPRKQLPHGDVAGVIVALEEHFIRKFADPELRGDGDDGRRRRPGQSDAGERCEGSALECGRRLALREAVNQFSRSGCVTCHEVEEDPARPMLERWRVSEVRLDEDWYPFSRFDHVAHLAQSRDQHGGRESCITCHSANTSEASEDILIPGKENCLQCHGESEHATSVALTCRGCHDFHLPFRDVMRSVETNATVSEDRNVTQVERGADDG